MKIIPIIFYVGMFLFLSSSTSAETTIKQGESNVNISISESDGNASVAVKNNEFTISGTIKSVSENSLNISGQPINFSSGVSIPSIGQKVTVKGRVDSNGTMTATSITIDSNSANSVLGTSTQVSINAQSPSPSPSPSEVQLGEISKLLDKLQIIVNKLFSLFG